MNRKLAIAMTIGLALATTGCSQMRMWGGGNGGEGGEGGASYMGGRAPVEADAAGTATYGTGSVSVSGLDERVNFSAGVGLD